MILIKKKSVFRELALSLHLMMHFDADTTSHSVIHRIRDKAKAALEAAAGYIGPFDSADIKAFLESKTLKFAVPCGDDIVVGDTIRFTEIVIDNRRRPPRNLGKRGVVAKVVALRSTNDQTMVELTVLSSGGAWELPSGTRAVRTLRLLSQWEAMRVLWEDENMRRPQS